MMKKILLVMIGLFALTLSACGASAAATPVKAEPATEASAQPVATLPPATPSAIPPTETSAPTVTAIPPTETAAAPAEVSFANDVMPILNNGGCTKCHGIEQVKEGLDMTSYANLMAGSFNGKVIVAGSANESLLVDMVTQGKMPKRGPKLTPKQIQVIINWINAGALNN